MVAARGRQGERAHRRQDGVNRRPERPGSGQPCAVRLGNRKGRGSGCPARRGCDQAVRCPGSSRGGGPHGRRACPRAYRFLGMVGRIVSMPHRGHYSTGQRSITTRKGHVQGLSEGERLAREEAAGGIAACCPLRASGPSRGHGAARGTRRIAVGALLRAARPINPPPILHPKRGRRPRHTHERRPHYGPRTTDHGLVSLPTVTPTPTTDSRSSASSRPSTP